MRKRKKGQGFIGERCLTESIQFIRKMKHNKPKQATKQNKQQSKTKQNKQQNKPNKQQTK